MLESMFRLTVACSADPFNVNNIMPGISCVYAAEVMR